MRASLPNTPLFRLLRLALYWIVAFLCGALLVIGLNVNVEHQSGHGDPVSETEKLLQKNREIRAQTQPTYPEGKTCYAFFSYLDHLSEHDYTGMTEDQVNAEIASQQKPVKDNLLSVKDKGFARPFSDYFAHHSKVDDEQDDEATRKQIKSISQVCSSQRATQVSPVSPSPSESVPAPPVSSAPVSSAPTPGA